MNTHKFSIALRCFQMLAVLVPLRLNGQAKEPGEEIATSGFVDFYYSRNFARPTSHNNKYRNFDVAENQFSLSLAEIAFQKTGGPIGFRIDADFGSTNDLVQGSSQSSLNNLQQAYISIIAPVGSGLTVEAGKFVTHMGLEVIESKDNWNYSRSFLFAWAIPYYHVGLRATYSVFGNLSVSGYLYNGWNNIVDNNDAKTLGATVNFTPVDGGSLILNWIGGAEQPDSIGAGRRNVVDIIAAYQATERLSIAANADYGSEFLPGGFVSWKGAALYGLYKLDDRSGLAVRGEIFSDPDGYATGIVHELREVTLTYEYRVVPNLLLRGEYRHDWSTVASFDERAGINVLTHQNTFAIGSVISF
ncbi:MAG: porin [Bacteroidota bacterium]